MIFIKTIEYIIHMNQEIKFNVALKKIQQEGTLAWEYNPFRNYRLDEDMIFYRNQFYTLSKFKEDYIDETKFKGDKELTIDDKQYKFNDIILKSDNEKNYSFQIEYKNGEELKYKECSDWSILGFSKTEEIPVFYQKGQLVDFITNELDFDLNHPVQITPQYSYDNSVDLIINDGKSLPKIINSRFSAIGKNKYRIIDRNGVNDTNIYDRGEQFKIDTSLYKITTKIPEITFGGESFGGNLAVGNYHFYFKFCDLDGNESDFVAQSGLVSVFIGSTPNSIHSGFRDQNSNKKIRFILYNIDQAYDYILVYYSKASGAEFEERSTKYVKILQKYKVSSGNFTIIDITGFETIQEVSSYEINERLQIYESAKTQAVSQNMLFLGNVTKSNENHEELSRLALNIYPQLDTSKTCDIDKLNDFYSGNTQNTYYNPNFIYNYTGYWDDEIYRFGVVFIKENNTLTPCYSIRGFKINSDFIDTDKLNIIKQVNNNSVIQLTTYDETTFEIDDDFKICSKDSLENAKGVCYIPRQDKLNTIIGLTFKTHESVIKRLQELNIKGFFIVRQKRIPTTLCQAYTIGIESSSHTPVIPTTNEYIYESFLGDSELSYNYFEDGKRKQETGYQLNNTFSNHRRSLDKKVISQKAAICPDYDVNSPYLNNLFSGSEFIVKTLQSKAYCKESSRLFTVDQRDLNISEELFSETKIIGVEDNVKLVGIGDDLFSARAGEAEEAFRFAYTNNKITTEKGGNNLIRGSFGNYLGLSGYSGEAGDLIDIKIPGYNIGNIQDYFKIRYNDASPFYPISDRITWDRLDDSETLGTFYRGDCYICKFTHRLNRNFQDPSAPTNDEIVDPWTWAKYMRYEDDVMKTDDLDKINLGDVNAVNLGMWVTFILRSNINHSVRSLDEGQVDEKSLIGNCRGFYPYHPMSAKAGYKLPECNTYNKGFEASVGEQIFEELPVAPYYKDIYSTRIAYSNLQITSAFKNAFRVFKSGQYRDYPITYGEITKIIEWNGDLICVLEHGIYKIPINERTVAGEGSGGNVYINTNNVLPQNPIVISDTFGSQWIDSVIKTPTGIYGVDTVAKKIWKVDNNGIELISDYKVQEFLNNNITFGERELTPIIGIRNVKTHYNAFKHDVMFTFYDDLNGISECVWNLCWNEALNKWITFYSWVPSFSENIYNQYFSFDRETSKQIAKLALNEKSEHNDYIYLDNTVMEKDNVNIGTMNYDLNVNGASVELKWELIHDPYGNYNSFKLTEDGKLSWIGDYDKFVNKIPDKVSFEGVTYEITDEGWEKEGGKNPLNDVTDRVLIKYLNKQRNIDWKKSFEQDSNDNLEPYESFDLSLNENNFRKRKAYTLNIKVTPTFEFTDSNASFNEFIATGSANAQLNMGSIERTVCVIPKEHLEVLSTDFWRHGQAGIFDITEDIQPTKWYGKQHPFEFEFIVRDQPDAHKIFDNLIIISNNAEPESFHYEIVGDCYEFAKDKKNMYIRQEATKELFQNCGNDIEFNSNYKELTSKHRPLEKYPDKYEKSTIFPAYYLRQDSLNTVEDYYHSRNGGNTHNFRDLCGAEIVYYKTLNEFRIWNHSRGVNMEENGPLRGNMRYLEDKWYVQISPVNLVQCNEPSWTKVDYGTGNKDNVPIELNQANFINTQSVEEIGPLKERGLVFWQEDQIRRSEIKPKDKYIKIRIRYSGEKLAIISAIKTLYSISYA